VQNIVASEQEIQLLRTVQNTVAESKMTGVGGYGQIIRSQGSDEFFEEQSITIPLNGTGEKELVNFLLRIGEGGSMIRVRDLDLTYADQNRYKLRGRVTLSANYQKEQAAKPAVTAATSGKPALKPAAKQ
jgi:hypothetical protein